MKSVKKLPIHAFALHRNIQKLGDVFPNKVVSKPKFIFSYNLHT